ncbi:MAG TPA: ABC transporter permease subunit [Trebonia sp.]|jgi:ABC-type nitrate/sulfonate/bicarbonate transport system permease component|nr:ABC transporter permease subunit [Trebonia sp.]
MTDLASQGLTPAGGDVLENPVDPSSARASQGAPGRRRHRLPPARGLLPLVVVLVIWQLAGDRNSPFFPPPSTWLDALRTLSDGGQLWPAVGASAELFGLSILIATVIGAVLGIVMGSTRPADRALGPTTEFLRALPAAALVPILVLVLGSSATTELVIVVLGTLWPVLLSTRDAMRTMNPLYADVARTLHLTRMGRLRKVTIPALFPALLLGVQVMAPTTLIVVILVELLTGLSGIGAQLATAQQSFLSAAVYGLVVVAALMAFILNLLLIGLERPAERYR